MTPFPLPTTPIVLPMARTFRGITQRSGLLVQGPGGWGEFLPFADYSTQEDANWLAATITDAVRPIEPGGTVQDASRRLAVNAILPELPEQELAPAAAALLARTGCRTLKVKAGGQPLEVELERLRIVADTVAEHRPDGELRIDGNGRFTVTEALGFVAAIRAAGLPVEYVEQPCSASEDLRQLRGSGVPIAVDESIRRNPEFEQEDLSWLQDIGDIAIIKTAPLRGSRFARQLVGRLPIPFIISGAAESSLGVARDAALAWELAPERTHGLGTGTLLADDLVTDPIVPSDGTVPVGPLPAPDPSAVRRATARMSPGDIAGWRDRIDAAWDYGLANATFDPVDLHQLGVPA